MHLSFKLFLSFISLIGIASSLVLEVAETTLRTIVVPAPSSTADVAARDGVVVLPFAVAETLTTSIIASTTTVPYNDVDAAIIKRHQYVTDWHHGTLSLRDETATVPLVGFISHPTPSPAN